MQLGMKKEFVHFISLESENRPIRKNSHTWASLSFELIRVNQPKFYFTGDWGAGVQPPAPANHGQLYLFL